MRQSWMGAALFLTLAGCKSEPDSGRMGSRPESAPEVIAPVPQVRAPGGSEQLDAPYSGYPGPVGRIDGGAGDAGMFAAPPSTAMPGARPLYPADAGAAADAGRRR